MKNNITWEQIKALIPEKVTLYNVDQNDSLDEHLDLIQSIIHSGDRSDLWDNISEWYCDPETEWYDNELVENIVKHFNITTEEAEEILDNCSDGIRDIMHDRDDSDVEKDLIKNTGKQVFFYDTAFEVEAESWNWDTKQVEDVCKEIKKVLSIKLKDDTWDESIQLMIRQATYGGQLVVYFYDDISDYMDIDQKINSIGFTNANIAIINTGNGSGDHCELTGLEFKLPFKRENLFLCKTIRYSYTYEVCGMSNDWCESTSVLLEKRNMKRTIETSSTHAHLEREARYNKTFKEGKCTTGDMDSTRHRKISYINNYPCGNKCSDCGTFWID